jgi:DNA-binding transcriptional LysR family regulator
LLRHARVALDALDAADREITGIETQRREVRLGTFISAGGALLLTALSALRRSHPEVHVSTREGTSPALVRAIRAGSLDLAVISSRPPHRPPDTDAPMVVKSLWPGLFEWFVRWVRW